MSQTSKNRFFHVGALIGLLALCGIVGCGEGMIEPTASAESALTSATFGLTTSGTYQGPGNGGQGPVTKIVAYANSTWIYGIRLYWGTTSKLYGETHGLAPVTYKLDGDLVYRIGCVVAADSLMGIDFVNVTSHFEIGLTGLQATAFDNADAVFTNLETWQGEVAGSNVLWGAKFHYEIP